MALTNAERSEAFEVTFCVGGWGPHKTWNDMEIAMDGYFHA